MDCTFTYSNICGYENAGESVSVWVRASYDIFRKEYKDAYNWHAWVDQDNTTYGEISCQLFIDFLKFSLI